jgi:hypothetical protein
VVTISETHFRSFRNSPEQMVLQGRKKVLYVEVKGDS